MQVECWSVILIVLAICVVYLKAHKNQYAFTVLPLCVLPLFHIMSLPLAQWIHPWCPLNYNEIFIGIDVIGLALSTLLLYISSKNIKNKKARIGFLVCSVLLNVILSVVLIESNIIY